MDIEISADSRTDDRRNRFYSRELLLSARLPWADHRTTNAPPVHAATVGTLLRRAIRESGALEHLGTEQRVASISSHGDGWPRGGTWRAYWHVAIEAKRPKEILSSEEAVAWAEEHVRPLFVRAIEGALARREESKRRERAARQANGIGAWAARTTMERARDAVRYEQRLAALKAELDAELAVQAKKLVESGDFQKAVDKWEAEDDHDPFEPEAVAYAREHFSQRHEHWNVPFGADVTWEAHHLFPPPETDSE